MAFEFTGTEILLFTESQSTLSSLVSNNQGLSYIAEKAIINEKSCYNKWSINLFNDKSVARYHAKVLEASFSHFIGPIFASTARTILQRFMRRVHKSRFPVNRKMFSNFTFVANDMVHVNDGDDLLSIVDLIRALKSAIMLFGDFLVGAMGPTRMIDMAQATDASAIAGPEAIKKFNNQLINTLHVPYIVNSLQSAQIKREFDFEPIFDSSRLLANDHVVLAACRHAVRCTHKTRHRLFDMNRQGEYTEQGVKTLALGATYREITEFISLPNVDYYIANADSKDTARISLDALRTIVKQKKSNLCAKDKKLLAEIRRNPRYTTDMSPADAVELVRNARVSNPAVGRVKKFLSFQDLMIKAEQSNGAIRPGSFKFAINDYRVTKDPNDCYTMLLAQDFGYNASTINWLEIFARTNAVVCMGYMALPLQLLFEDLPPSDLFSYMKHKRNVIWDSHVKAAPFDGSHRNTILEAWNDGLLNMDWACMTHSYSNGYSHPYKTWSLLMRKPLLTDPNYDFALEVQIETRFGPMVEFTLTRVQKTAMVCRRIALPQHMRYIRLLDLPELVSKLDEDFYYPSHHPLPYFSVYADEFYVTLAYAQSLDIKSMTKQTLSSFVKAHRSGAALVAKELCPKWQLEPQDIYKFVQVVYYHTLYLHTKLGSDIDDIIKINLDWRTKVKGYINRGIKQVVGITKWLWSWMVSTEMAEHLVVEGVDSYFQEGATICTSVSSKRTKHPFDNNSFPDGIDYNGHTDITNSFCDPGLIPDGFTFDDWMAEPEAIVKPYQQQQYMPKSEIPDYKPKIQGEPDSAMLKLLSNGKNEIKSDAQFHKLLHKYHTDVHNFGCSCPICISIAPNIGSQVVDCYYDATQMTEINVTIAELDQFKEDLRVQVQNCQSEALTKTLEAAMENTPKSEFSISVKCEYIKGGPGTGKSRMIRSLANTTSDMIVAPFQKLRTDYKNQPSTSESGAEELTSWDFHTHHRAMTMRNKQKIFFDEFTGIPYIVFAIILYNCQAKTVYLVGDEQQTGIIAGNNEGTPIKEKIDLTTLSRHNLLCNFRNPVPDVKTVNHMFGTRMIPMSNNDNGMIFRSNVETSRRIGEDYTFMHYSWQSAVLVTGEADKSKKTSVRCNQGTTHKKIALRIDKQHDDQLLTVPELNFVALTRHTDELSIDIPVQSEQSAIVSNYIHELSNTPEHVQEADYVTKLFFEVENTSCPFSYELGAITKRFLNLVKVSGAYPPAGPAADDITENYDEVVEPLREVVKQRVNEFSSGKVKGWLSHRENNCLMVAVASALNISLSNLDDRLTRHKWYQKWLQSDRLSTMDDCDKLAKSLNMTLIVMIVNDEFLCVTEHICKCDGATETIRISYKTEEDVGHFYYSENDEQAVTDVSYDGTSSDTDSEALVPVTNKDKNKTNGKKLYDAFKLLGYGLLNNNPTSNPFEIAGGAKKKPQTALAKVLQEVSSGNIIPGRVDPVQQELYTKNFGLSNEFTEYASVFVPNVLVSYLMASQKDLDVIKNNKPKGIKPISDSYRLATNYEFMTMHTYTLPTANHEMSNVIGDKFVSGQLNMEIMMPTNQRRHPKTQKIKYRAAGNGPALVYNQKNQFQQLQVTQARYLGRKAADQPSTTRTKLAMRIADRFVDECLEPNLDIVMTDENIYKITSRSLADMVRKHYEKQMDVNNTAGARVYRFQLKDIEKPFKDAMVDLGKSGQGILAWSKDAHVLFMTAFRLLNSLLLQSVKPNVVYDNSMSEEQFLEKVNASMLLTPDCAVNSVIDATACDSGQNGFTQEIEKQIYTRLGASDFILDWYFSFREKYILQSEHVRASMTNVKTSGEPGTLLGNSILMAAILNSLVRGEGPFTLVTKGDDGFKRQAKPHYDAEMLQSIKHFCPLDFKIDIDVPITFCGYALVGKSLYPDILRKLAKVVTHRFKTYEHFSEYQVSLRDWINRIPSDPEMYMRLLAVNAELAGRTVEQVEHMVMQIQSFSHIGKRQFEECFPEVEYDIEPPPHHYSELPPTAVSNKQTTVFVPAENAMKRAAMKVKYNL